MKCARHTSSKTATQEGEADVNLHMLVYEAGHNFVVLHVMRAMSELLRNNIFFNRENLYLKAGVREKLLAAASRDRRGRHCGRSGARRKSGRRHIRFVFDTVAEIQRANTRLKTSLMRAKRSDFLASLNSPTFVELRIRHLRGRIRSSAANFIGVQAS